MNKTWKAVLGVILIFVFGCLCGAIVASIAIHHRTLAVLQGGPAALTKVLERRFTHNLGLNDSQKQTVHDAILKNLMARREAQKQLQPQIRQFNQATLAEVDAVLNPDQQKLFLQNVQEFRKERFGKNANNAEADAQPAAAPPAVGNAQPGH